MIIIEKPYTAFQNEKVFLRALITDEQNGLKEECYYVTNQEYGKYFCDEIADAFVIGLLLPALQSNQDIIVKGALSERLYFNLCNTIVFSLSEAFKYQAIRILPQRLVNIDFKSFAVATGCSLGIDSFATILKHTSDQVPKNYRLTHLAIFNAGAYGEKDLSKVKLSFQNDLNELIEFSNEINMPLVSIESNLAYFYTSTSFDYNQTNVIRIVSTILSIQKLFKKYIFSSSYPLQQHTISALNLAYFQSILLPSFSTTNTEIIDGEPYLTRCEKTSIIADNELVRKHLHVCLRDLVLNDLMPIGPWVNLNSDKRNCSGCEKCLRTLVTLDILDKLQYFNKVFDLQKYRSLRKLYFAKIIGLKNRDYFSNDIYKLAKSRKFKMPLLSRTLSFLYKLRLIDIYYNVVSKIK